MTDESTKETSIVPVEAELEKTFELESQTLKEQLESQVEEPLLKNTKRLAYYIGRVGLSLDEACVLTDMDPEWFLNQMKLNPVIEKVIKIKELEYKKDLLSTLSRKARGGDDKMSMWLLERRYPGEFGTRKRADGSSSDGDLIFEAIEFIQKNGDNTPLVGETSGRAISVRKGGNKNLVQKVQDILS